MRKFLKYWLTALFAVVYALAALSQPNNDSLNMRSVLHYPQTAWGTGASNINTGLWGYNDTATGDPACAVLDFGSDKTSTGTATMCSSNLNRDSGS
jgi:hypothetical protein